MLKKILIVVLLLVLVVGGVLAYLWTQATALPEWYDPDAVEAADGEPHWVASGEGEGEVEIRGFHKNTPLVSGPASEAIKASRAVRRGDHMEAGVVVDTRKVPRKKLSGRDRDALERALDSFPGLADRDVYIGIDDEPTMVDGVPQLSANAKLKIGEVSYPLADAARRLGMDEARLRAQLNKRLRDIARQGK